MADVDITLDRINICFHYYPFPEEEMSSTVTKMQEMEFPSELPNRQVFLNTPNPTDSELTLSEGDPSVSIEQASENTFTTEIGERDDEIDLHTHIYTTPNQMETHLSMFHEIWDEFDEIELRFLNAYFDVSKGSDELSIIDIPDPDISIPGIRIENDGIEYIFYGEEDTVVRADLEEEVDIAPQDIDNLTESNIDKAEEFLRRAYDDFEG